MRSDSDLCVVVDAKTASRQSAALKLDRRVVLPAKTASRQRNLVVRVGCGGILLGRYRPLYVDIARTTDTTDITNRGPPAASRIAAKT